MPEKDRTVAIIVFIESDWTDAVVIFPGEVLAFQNIERQALLSGHPLRAVW